jgi:hypothetical protein
LQIKATIPNSHTADSKPVKQEVNSTVIHPPLVFPAYGQGKYGWHLRCVIPLTVLPTNFASGNMANVVRVSRYKRASLTGEKRSSLFTSCLGACGSDWIQTHDLGMIGECSTTVLRLQATFIEA